MRRLIALVGLAATLAACGGHRPAVLGARLEPGPGTERRLVAGLDTSRGFRLSPYVVALPSRLPAPSKQRSCADRATVVLTVWDHAKSRTVSYGPCVRPAAIERLWRSMLVAYRDVQRPIPGAPTWLALAARTWAANLRELHPRNIRVEHSGGLVTVFMQGRFTCIYCVVGPDGPARMNVYRKVSSTYDAKTHRKTGSGLDAGFAHDSD